ncbi:serine hydrolase domain-containing protein [Kineobactrum salinum]|uniref:Beta-lactamase family protein n=1 Tax=Kineobactrum salinum TaxID=2708301 RepID=A0A6C0U0L4_9GAMM|nr:serine hydrolase domain-containing protein [Kineobactrum salinum]QIB65448.1 beta-lactamase family protein [Kineobactrum salinum]
MAKWLMAIAAFYLHSLTCSAGQEVDYEATRGISPKSEKIDNFLLEKLHPLVRREIIPGFVYTIVEGGEVAISRGIGYSDLAAGEPIDPDLSLMRVGSITKSFTALAIHQLVDEGKIDLDEDANSYLSSEYIPDTYDKPVTVRDLLTHMAGFDGNISGASVTSNADIAVEDGWMSRQFIRLQPAGELMAYDNTAYAALGQILVDQTGKSYRQVLEERIFKPLGMNKTTVGIPDPRAEEAAGCYDRASGDLKPCKHELLKETYQAAGDASTTATDMSRFLLALLNEGELLGTRIISRIQFAKFRTPAFKLHPETAGIGMGSYETGPPGHGVFGHSGGIRGGSSLYLVLPEHNIAVFLAINASVSDDFDTTLSGLLSMALAPSTPDNLDPGDLATFELPAEIPALFYKVRQGPETFTSCPHDLEGNYQYIRAAMYSSIAIRLLGPLAMSPIVVKRETEDSWTIADKGPYEEVDTCLFRLRGRSYADGEIATLVGFNKTDSGVLVGGGHPLAGWSKLSWHASPVISVLPYFLSIVILVFLGVVYMSAPARLSSAFLYGGIGAVLLLTGLLLEMEYHTPVYQYGGQIIPLLLWRAVLHAGLLLLVVSTVKGVQALFGPDGSVLYRFFLVVLVVSSMIALTLSFYWGLVGNFSG